MGPEVATRYTAPSLDETLSSVFNSMICKQHAMFNKLDMFKGSGCGTSECVRICNELDWNFCSLFGLINASVRISYKLDRIFCIAPHLLCRLTGAHQHHLGTHLGDECSRSQSSSSEQAPGMV